MTDTVISALTPALNWEINQLAVYGPWKWLAAHAVGLLVLWCSAGTAIHLYDRARERSGKGAAE